MTQVTRDMIRYGIVLLLFCAIAAGGLAFTYAATRPQIEAQAKAESERACKVVMPGAEFKRRDDLLQKVESIYPDVLGQGKGKIFEGFKNGKMVGVVVQLAPRGYGGPVAVAVAIQDGKVTGFTVVDHKETAGLGSKIKDDPAWGKQFIGKTAKDQLEVKKDVVAITGATKSSKAATQGVKIALEVYTRLYGGASK